MPVAPPILSATDVRKTYRTGTHEVEALTPNVLLIDSRISVQIEQVVD